MFNRTFIHQCIGVNKNIYYLIKSKMPLVLIEPIAANVN